MEYKLDFGNDKDSGAVAEMPPRFPNTRQTITVFGRTFVVNEEIESAETLSITFCGETTVYRGYFLKEKPS